jgi:hypothetical protein
MYNKLIPVFTVSNSKDYFFSFTKFITTVFPISLSSLTPPSDTDLGF